MPQKFYTLIVSIKIQIIKIKLKRYEGDIDLNKLMYNKYISH